METGISFFGRIVENEATVIDTMSNNQVLQKSRIFVEATNEIAGRLSMSEERPHRSGE